jgi:DNA-binding response OmpR family regulator
VVRQAGAVSYLMLRARRGVRHPPERSRGEFSVNKRIGEPARILIVEDNEFLAVDLDMTLASCGYAPSVAPTVSAALMQIERREVDAAVLDVSLFGGEPVYPVADALMAADIPFVFLTGRARHHLPIRFKSARLLSKPYKLAELQASLEDALADFRRRDGLAESE